MRESLYTLKGHADKAISHCYQLIPACPPQPHTPQRRGVAGRARLTALVLLCLLGLLGGDLAARTAIHAAPPNQTEPQVECPLFAEGETWFISWSATGEGYHEGAYGRGGHTVKSRRVSMEGAAVARHSKENPYCWKTGPFRWTVIDDERVDNSEPCLQGGAFFQHRHTWITNPTQPPSWVDYYLFPGQIFEHDDGSKYMQGLTFSLTNGAQSPSFNYKLDDTTRYCGRAPASGSIIDDRQSYALIIWGNGGQNPVSLECDAQGATCWKDYEYVIGPTTEMPMYVSWHIRARRLPDSPSITQKPELLERNVFLPGVPLSARIDGVLDCDHAATCKATRRVRAPSGAVTSEAIAGASGNYPATLDIGSLEPGVTLVTAQADAASAAPPDTKQVQVAAKLPQWAADLAGIIAHKVGDYVAYRWEVKFPKPEIKQVFDVPSFVPFIGGKKSGVVLPQATLKVEAKSTGEVSLEGSIGGAVLLGGNQIGIEIAGKANGVLDLQGVRNVHGQAQIKVFGKLTAKEALVKAVPALRPAIAAIQKFSPSVAKWLEERAQAVLEIVPSWAGIFDFSDKTGEIEIDQATIQPSIAFKVMAMLKAYEEILEAGVGVGGEVKATIPTPPLSLKELAVDLLVRVEGVLLHFGFSEQAGYTCKFPQATCQARGDLAAAEAGQPVWSLLDRSYLNDPDYAAWTAGDPAQRETESAALAAGLPIDIQLVDNIYPQAHPSLAHSVGRRLILWSHDAPAKPDVSGQDLRFSFRPNNSNDSWIAPAALTDDSRADFNREAIYSLNGKAVAVWQRFDSSTPGDMNQDPQAYLSHVQVAAAVWNGTTWSAPVQLSTSGSTNGRPNIAETPTGAIVVWIGNAANQLIGDATHPDTVYYATYTYSTNTWGAAAAALTNVAGLINLRLASRGDDIALVYARDLDGDFTTDTDREIFYTLYTTGWAAPVRLTNNQLDDELPLLTWNKTGAPLLVWQQGDNLRFLDGTWDAAAAQTLAFATPGSQLRLVNDNSVGDKDLLALTWQQVTGVDTRVGYAIYDGNQNLWSTPQTLTPPVTGLVTETTTLANEIASTMEGDRLLLAYLLAEVEPTNVTLDGATFTNVPDVGTYALRYAEIPLAANARITDTSVTVTPLDAGPGEVVTIAAAISNTGQLPTVPTQVSLVTLTNNTAITRTLPVIPGGGVVTVTFAYTQPTTSASALEIRIDPFFKLLGDDRTDNTAAVYIAPLFTTLATVDTPLGPMVGAVFAQQGAIQGNIAHTATLHLDGETGPVVGEVAAAFPATPVLQTVTTTLVLSPTQLGPGPHMIFWVGRTGLLGLTGANVAADLSLYPEEVVVAGDTLSATVSNLGDWPSAGGDLVVYDKEPAAAGAQELARFPLPNLGAGDTTAVGGAVGVASGATAGRTAGLPPLIYVELEAGESAPDLDPTNNLFAVGELTQGNTAAPSVYLPWVSK